MSGRDCPGRTANLARCPCDWEPCERKGVCCECIAYHAKHGERPACVK